VNYTDGNRKDLLPKNEDGSPLYVEVLNENTANEETVPMRYFKVYKNTVMAKKNLHSFLVDYQGRVIERAESDREHYEIFWDRLRRKNDPTELAAKTFGII
jgi:glutathione peroxidase-family protein